VIAALSWGVGIHNRLWCTLHSLLFILRLIMARGER
jgi:hypothetical protein